MRSCENLCDLAYKIFMYIGINQLRQDAKLIRKMTISSDLSIPWSTVSYYITRLYGDGLIKYDNKIIVLTDKGTKLFKYLWQNVLNRSKYRAHKIQVVMDIVCRDFDKVKKISIPFSNKRYSGLKLEMLGCKVLIYSNNRLVCNIPDVYADKTEDLLSAIGEFIGHLVQALESEFNIKVTNYQIADYKDIHVAVLDSILAKSVILKTGRTYDTGNIGIDKSKEVYELETTNPSSAIKDIEKIVKYEDLAREIESLKSQVLSYRDKIGEIKSQEQSHRDKSCEKQDLDIW